MSYEASRKKQVLVLQPRGKPLYEDTSSFGLKMLQSMGWKKGNGLGRNQQGNQEFIQVRYRNNASGLGYDGLKDNQWTETELNFDSLLKNLNAQSNSNSNSGDDNLKPTKSLEEMSKKSRARIHYKKFTKGKDVSKYSEKDLANIFGKKSLKELEKVEQKEEDEIEISNKEESYKSDLIINTGVSIQEYFKQKQKRTCEDNSFTKDDLNEPKTKKKKIKEIEINVVTALPSVEKKDKKKKTIKEHDEILEESTEIDTNVKRKKSKKFKEKEDENLTAEINEAKIDKKKKKVKKDSNLEISNEKIANDIIESKEKTPTVTENSTTCKDNYQFNLKNEFERPKGANAIYSTEVVQISSYVAQKMSSIMIENFASANIGDIIGYGMHENFEIKVVQTKMGESINNTDKYAIYNTDKLIKPRVNPRKILTKIKRTKKCIQVI